MRWILVILVLSLGCRSVQRQTITTVKDSVVIREYEVPITIKESRIQQELSLDSLCNELEAIKAQLRESKTNTTSIIYRQANNQKLEAMIDSMGRLLVLSQREQMDTLIKGQETIKTRTKSTEKIVEKEPAVKWWMWLIIGASAVFLLKIIKKFIPFSGL